MRFTHTALIMCNARCWLTIPVPEELQRLWLIDF